ncbi:hypothetical protein PQO03_04300 [Lentisphaera profundi]|uniref:Uncharacterized protein n=1 Tax=Lentisphaera profundi TaxID=1658616 RepID=A0ABY7VSJ7_9BACT|nr:hypothetical protein [Lentisphaera profundi]WDE97175.1 hypothetical protein PQO03_04300 [Lentisphaera profundi]
MSRKKCPVPKTPAEDISEKSELTQENPERLSELYKEFIDLANERKLK